VFHVAAAPASRRWGLDCLRVSVAQARAAVGFASIDRVDSVDGRQHDRASP
jgi:hypothetical protein